MQIDVEGNFKMAFKECVLDRNGRRLSMFLNEVEIKEYATECSKGILGPYCVWVYENFDNFAAQNQTTTTIPRSCMTRSPFLTRPAAMPQSSTTNAATHLLATGPSIMSQLLGPVGQNRLAVPGRTDGELPLAVPRNQVVVTKTQDLTCSLMTEADMKKLLHDEEEKKKKSKITKKKNAAAQSKKEVAGKGQVQSDVPKITLQASTSGASTTQSQPTRSDEVQGCQSDNNSVVEARQSLMSSPLQPLNNTFVANLSDMLSARVKSVNSPDELPVVRDIHGNEVHMEDVMAAKANDSDAAAPLFVEKPTVRNRKRGIGGDFSAVQTKRRKQEVKETEGETINVRKRPLKSPPPVSRANYEDFEIAYNFNRNTQVKGSNGFDEAKVRSIFSICGLSALCRIPEQIVLTQNKVLAISEHSEVIAEAREPLRPTPPTGNWFDEYRRMQAAKWRDQKVHESDTESNDTASEGEDDVFLPNSTCDCYVKNIAETTEVTKTYLDLDNLTVLAETAAKRKPIGPTRKPRSISKVVGKPQLETIPEEVRDEMEVQPSTSQNDNSDDDNDMAGYYENQQSDLEDSDDDPLGVTLAWDVRGKKIEHLRAQYKAKKAKNVPVIPVEMSIDDLILTCIIHMDEKGRLQQFLNKVLEGEKEETKWFEMSRQVLLLYVTKNDLIVDYLHRYMPVVSSMDLIPFQKLHMRILNYIVKVMPKDDIVFDYVNHCIRRGTSDDEYSDEECTLYTPPSPPKRQPTATVSKAPHSDTDSGSAGSSRFRSTGTLDEDDEDYYRNNPDEESSSSESDTEVGESVKEVNRNPMRRLGFRGRGRPKAKERQKVEGDLEKIDEENCGKWTDYELASWLQVYDTETEFDRSTTEVSRWRRFARRIREEFNVKRSHIQCQKQKLRITRKFHKLSSTTGADGNLTQLDLEIKRVMAQDKDVTGDTVGSAARGIQVTDPVKKGEVLDVFKKIDEEEKFQKEMVTAEKRKKRCAGQSGKLSKKGGGPKRKTSMDSSQGAQQHQNQQPQNQEPENQEEDEVLTSQGNDEPYVPSASQMRNITQDRVVDVLTEMSQVTKDQSQQVINVMKSMVDAMNKKK